MKNPTIRFTRAQIRQIEAALRTDVTAENAAFAFCTQVSGESRPILIAQDLSILDENDYAVRSIDRLSIEPATMLAVARTAARHGRSICMMHIHPMSQGDVSFSYADDAGDARSHLFFRRMVPGIPHVSVVFDSRCEAADARASGFGSEWQAMDVRVCGSPLRFLSGDVAMTEPALARYDRQQRLLGEGGQAALSRLFLVVVGAGGLGSLVATGLVHSGVGRVLVIDPDCADETSLNRLFGAVADDGKHGTAKVAIAARYANALNPEAGFTVFKGDVEDPDILPSLVAADAIVCTTDTMRSRAHLNQLCYQYSVPLLDVGCQFQVHPSSGELVNEIGKVNLITPESACLLCSGHVQPDVLYAEGLTAGERQQLVDEGYVRGLAGPEPSMQMYNMQVSGLGLQRLLNHLLGVQLVPTDYYERLSFFGVGGRPYWKRVAKRRDPDCIVCGERTLIRGAGDSQSMMIRSAAA